MSLELECDWIPHAGGMWIDLNRLTCDVCGIQSPWGEVYDIGAGWDHMLGLDCCPICTDTFYRAGGVFRLMEDKEEK